jgi:16S rRNA (adenine1518-N6/adenine1519-N6)-dimethyltransferase
MEKVKAKNTSDNISWKTKVAKAIADTINLEGYEDVLEIGPGWEC